MTVRDGLLALLTLGPAYGLQLHSEFLDRAAHRGRLNVGQIYATLDRLRDRGLVDAAGRTDDGLPLHSLTDAGRAAASAWLAGEGAGPEEDWDDILDRILIASSLPGVDVEPVLDAYARRPEEPDAEHGHAQQRLAARASALRERSLLALIAASRTELRGAGPGGDARAFVAERPRRGRRTGVTKAALSDDVA